VAVVPWPTSHPAPQHIHPCSAAHRGRAASTVRPPDATPGSRRLGAIQRAPIHQHGREPSQRGAPPSRQRKRVALVIEGVHQHPGGHGRGDPASTIGRMKLLPLKPSWDMMMMALAEDTTSTAIGAEIKDLPLWTMRNNHLTIQRKSFIRTSVNPPGYRNHWPGPADRRPRD